MRFRNPSLWIALVTALALTGVVVGKYGTRVSPGPLSAVHGRESDLNGGWDCASCHGGFGESMAEACLECHVAVGLDMERGTGLHGVLEKRGVERCAGCHGEHHGVEFVPVGPASFARAGIESMEEFDHELVGYQLDGKHLELECEECHTHARSPELPKGARRFLGLHADCRICHSDPHSGRMTMGCAECHDAHDFREPGFRGHDEFLPLIGGHGGLSCRECHSQTGLRPLEGIGRGRTPAPRGCVDCHASPHRASFVAGNAALAGTTQQGSCAACHQPEHEAFRDSATALTPEQHAVSGFALAHPHEAVACSECHASDGGGYGARYPGRPMNDCASCHEDVHRGQFDASPLAARGCISCHDVRHFAPHAFTLGRHARTALPLDGAHRESECRECHEEPEPGAARRFRGTPARCEKCHKDAHQGAFDEGLSGLPAEPRGTCVRCHSTHDFADVPETRFDHGRWTDFALLGAHAEARCEECHAPRKAPDDAGRLFGLVTERFGAVSGCASCHPDPHLGLFDDAALPEIVDGRVGCARCHSEASFRLTTEDFDHGTWTGFELDGTHGELACTECHAPLGKPDARGRTLANALGPACADCHDDPHAGQFVRADGSNLCTPCHRTERTFSDLFFNHQLHSRYRLDETHSSVACSGCHPTFEHEGEPVIRYRPLGTECSDCHGAPQEPLRRRRNQ